MPKVLETICDEVIEQEKYVDYNEKNLKRLREECEKAENISKQFTNYIKEKKKRNFVLEKGMWGIRNLPAVRTSPFECNLLKIRAKLTNALYVSKCKIFKRERFNYA